MFREIGFPVPWWTDLVVMAIALTALISCRRMTKRDWETLLETEWFSRVFGILVILAGVVLLALCGGLRQFRAHVPREPISIRPWGLCLSFVFMVLGLLYLVLGARFSRQQLEIQRFGPTTRDQIAITLIGVVGATLGLCYLGWLTTGRFWPVLPG